MKPLAYRTLVVATIRVTTIDYGCISVLDYVAVATATSNEIYFDMSNRITFSIGTVIHRYMKLVTFVVMSVIQPVVAVTSEYGPFVRRSRPARSHAQCRRAYDMA